MWVTMGPWLWSPASTRPRRPRRSRCATPTPVRWSSSGRAPHPPRLPPRSEQDPKSWWTAFRAAWSEAGSPTVAALSVAGQQHGMVVTDEDGTPVAPGEALERHRDRARRRLADQEARRRGRRGPTPSAASRSPRFTITKLSWLHRTEADVWARMRSCLPAPRLAHVEAHGPTRAPTAATRPAPATGRPSRSEYRYDLLEIVGADIDWKAMVPAVLGPTETAGTLGRRRRPADRRVRHGRQHGRGARHRARRRRDRACRSAPPAPRTSSASGPPRTPTGAVAGFADATGRYLPLVCTLNATKVTDAVARVSSASTTTGSARSRSTRRRAPAGSPLLPWFDGERTPNRPDATGASSACAATSLATSSPVPRTKAWCADCSTALDALDAAGRASRARASCSSAAARTRPRTDASSRICRDGSSRCLGDDEQVAKGACVQAARAAPRRVAGGDRRARGSDAPSRRARSDPDVDRDGDPRPRTRRCAIAS